MARKMDDDRTITLYLAPPMAEDAAAGRVNIVNRIAAAVAPAGFTLTIAPDTAADRARAATAPGFHLFHMQEPLGPRCLCLRRVYFYPFWAIEATNERWNWTVAEAPFHAADQPRRAADGFLRRWRAKLLGDGPVTRDGFVFLPLQGRLLDHRSFQTTSPLGMVEATLAAEPRRPLVATLHPKETYGANEIAALDDLVRRFPRLRVVQADARDLLRGCDYVVTQNSAVGLTGFFAEKPCVQFARIDFHHIAGSVPRQGVGAAFAQVADAPAPDFAAYLWWFFRDHAINGGAPEAEDQIRLRLCRGGWPVQAR